MRAKLNVMYFYYCVVFDLTNKENFFTGFIVCMVSCSVVKNTEVKFRA